jgi:hypothetical protein
MSALLMEIFDAHGGVARWSGVRAIDVALKVSGALLDRKNVTGARRAALAIDALDPWAGPQWPGAGPGERWIFTLEKVRLRRPMTAP